MVQGSVWGHGVTARGHTRQPALSALMVCAGEPSVAVSDQKGTDGKWSFLAQEAVVLGGFSVNVFNVFSPSPFPKQGITQNKTKVRKAQPHLVKQSIYLNPRESVSFSFVSLAYFLKTVNSFFHAEIANPTFRSGTPARNNAENFLKSKSIC